MPAPIVVVLRDRQFGDQLLARLKEAGREAILFSDTMLALGALERAATVELLVTTLEHESGTPNPLALARMGRLRRPGMAVLCVGPAELERHVAGIGHFLTAPVSLDQLYLAIEELLD